MENDSYRLRYELDSDERRRNSETGHMPKSIKTRVAEFIDVKMAILHATHGLKEFSFADRRDRVVRGRRYLAKNSHLGR